MSSVPRASSSHAHPPRDAPRLLSLLNSTLSSSHELVRSMAIVSKPSPSLVRPIKRNLSTVASGIVGLQREQFDLEEAAKKGKVSLAEVRQKEDEIVEVKGAWDRLCDVLEKDSRTGELLHDVRQSHPSLFEAIQHNASTIEQQQQNHQSHAFQPYHDDDVQDQGADSAALLQSQHQQMEQQDNQLDALSDSIGRQHHLSLQMNEELGTHAELLEEMDRDVDGTTARLGRASRRLDKFTKSLKEHGSTWTIFILIVILVLLIAIFK